ncbi:hypothetical protein [Haloquadratum walsbyi]|jgi:hypothetical protein|uniref:Uncharacterized protein n=1 Tax=Haloquadratum walsbyi J07HQW2 TaxID=1238425 RepID=U1NBF8_9EURY|nr:hypothetical protein [Haloquadratum walsbyi]ERG94220.1 MAG: hypothetical protein J07HQW2_00654 [Haloquadratum walsbyi J07HQW2]
MTDTNASTETEPGSPRIDDEREVLIFGETIDVAPHGLAKFSAADYARGDPITPQTAETALNRGYVAPEDSQYRGPTAEELLEILKAYDESTTPPYFAHRVNRFAR